MKDRYCWALLALSLALHPIAAGAASSQRVQAAPVLDALTPATIPVDQLPRQISASGSGFTAATRIRVGATEITPSVISPSVLTFTLPALPQLQSIGSRMVLARNGPELSNSRPLTLAPGAPIAIDVSAESPAGLISDAQVRPGELMTYSATAYDTFGNDITALTVAWTVSSGAIIIASNADSVVLAAGQLAPVTATVTASDGAISGTGRLIIVSDVITPTEQATRIEISPLSTVLEPGLQQRFRARVFGSSGNELAIPIQWRALPAAGVIDATGLFTAGTTPGFFAASIQASTGVLSATASVEVVTPAQIRFAVHVPFVTR